MLQQSCYNHSKIASQKFISISKFLKLPSGNLDNKRIRLMFSAIEILNLKKVAVKKGRLLNTFPITIIPGNNYKLVNFNPNAERNYYV